MRHNHWIELVFHSEKIRANYKDNIPNLVDINWAALSFSPDFREYKNYLSPNIEAQMILRLNQLPAILPKKWDINKVDALDITFSLVDVHINYFNLSSSNFANTKFVFEKLENGSVLITQFDNINQKIWELKANSVSLAAIKGVNIKVEESITKYPPLIRIIEKLERGNNLMQPQFNQIKGVALTNFTVYPNYQNHTDIWAVIVFSTFEPSDAMFSKPEEAVIHSHYFEFRTITIDKFNINKDNFIHGTLSISAKENEAGVYQLIYENNQGEILLSLQAKNIYLRHIINGGVYISENPSSYM